MRILSLSSICFILLITYSLPPLVSAEVTADPMGFCVAVEEGEEEAGTLLLTNTGEEDANYSLRFRKIRREEDRRRGPLRDDPGDVLQEIDLEYNYNLGLSFDADNSVMWGTHTVPNRIVGYEWNGEEITGTIGDFQAEGNPVGCGYYQGVIYVNDWITGGGSFSRYDIDGENLGNVESGLQNIMGIATDQERGHLYLLGQPSCDVMVLDIEDDFERIGLIDNILNGADAVDMRSRLTWVPAHDDGHLWVSWRPDPNDEPSWAWQVSIDEDWNWEEVQNFHVETDNRSFGIGHDGENLWISTASLNDNNVHTLRIVDDGINETSFIVFDEEEGVVPAGDDLELEYMINPEEFEEGVHEILFSIRFENEEIETINMSIVMSLVTPATTVSGVIADADGDAIEGATIIVDALTMQRYSDENGTFDFSNLPADDYEFTISMVDYLTVVEEVTIEEGDDDIELEITLLQAVFTASVELIEHEMGEDDEFDYEFSVENEGNGTLTFNATKSLIGDADVDPWEIRADLNIGEEVDDRDISGAVFVNGRFYVTGENNDHPTIYVFSRDGALIDTFAQPQDDDATMRDLAWDGEYLWGSVSRMIYRFDLEGNLERSFRGAFPSISSLAWDPERQLLWTAATTNGIVGLDIDGNEQVELDRRNMRIYGLSYWEDDPDGFNLYITQFDGDEDLQIMSKMNPDNGDLEHVRDLQLEANVNPRASFITNRFDIYSWVLISTVSISPNNGGDRIDIWQLDSRRDWFDIDPVEGEIAAGETTDFVVHFNSNALPAGEVYEAQFVFDHTGIGSQTTIPLALSIADGNVFARRRLDLDFGWNMISTNLQPDPDDIIELTQPLVDEGILTLMKDGVGRFYSPENEFNSIPPWDVAQGYLMKMTEDSELNVEGISVSGDTPIDLLERWQMVAYFPRQPVDAIIALSGIADVLLLAKDEDGNFYNPEFGFSNMGDLREGKGYMMKLSEDAELVYRLRAEDERAAALEQRGKSYSHRRKILPRHETTGRNMSLLVKTNLSDDSEIGVYSDGILVGSGMVENGVCGLAIWGDDQTTDELDGALDKAVLEIKGFSNLGELECTVEIQAGDLEYHTDNFTVLKLSSASAVPAKFALDTPYPNPFNSTVKLSFNIVNSGVVKLSIYDVTGRKITELINEERNAGVHSLTWNAEAQPSGIYLARLSSRGKASVVKMTLIR